MFEYSNLSMNMDGGALDPPSPVNNEKHEKVLEIHFKKLSDHFV
jgi:hypothetical protein